MTQRNRSDGWKHAKISGHENERLIEDILNGGKLNFLPGVFLNQKIKSVSIGGLKEVGVDGVLGRKTKSKTDLKVVWINESQSNFSIKKSLGGQVFLIKTSSFISGFESQYKKSVPNNVKNAIVLFFGDGDLATQMLKKLPIEDEEIRKYEIRKRRLVWSSLQKCSKKDADALLQWIKDNIEVIVDFCFSKGLASNSRDWAQYVWYKNIVESNAEVDFCVSVDDLMKACSKAVQCIKPGDRNGGTTILLPFGFVQWHQGQMQFHHKLPAIKNLPGLIGK